MRTIRLGAAAFAIAVLAAGLPERSDAQQNAGPAIQIGNSDLGGIVTGPNGLEAGVWVIAETTELPTKLAKIVVTDDRGHHVIPDLPKANYSLWVRGYGLVDSPKVRSEPGKLVNLTAVPAPNAAAAVQYYPPIYWYAMLRVPEASEFPVGKVRNQGEWLTTIKSGGCIACHGLGTPGRAQSPTNSANSGIRRKPGSDASSPGRRSRKWPGKPANRRRSRCDSRMAGRSPPIWITGATLWDYASLLNNARSMAATPSQTFWRFQLPAAMPHVFAGLKIATSLSVIGAIVAEFVGSDAGLGHIMMVANADFNITRQFAAIVILSLIGLVFFWSVELLERILIPWHVSVRRDAARP